MESLLLLAFGEEEFFIAFAMACPEAFFNKLLVALPEPPTSMYAISWTAARRWRS